MDLYRRLWRGMVCLLVVAGAGIAFLLVPWGTLLGLSLLAATLGMLFGAGVYAQSHRQSAPPRYVLAACACAVASVIALSGLVAFLGAVALLVVLLLAVTFPPVVRVLLLRAPRAPDPMAAAPAAEDARPSPPPQQTPEPAPDLQRLDDRELCWRWRTSFTALQHTVSPAERLRLIDTRAALLDELARRNPQGFSRWLDEGARAASDPARYFSDARQNPRRPGQQRRESDH